MKLKQLSKIIILLSLAVIGLFVLKFVNFTNLTFAIPEYTTPNYSSMFIPFSEESPVVQTITSEYGNLAGVKLRLNFEDAFTGSITLRVRSVDNPSVDLFEKDYVFVNESFTNFHNFTFNAPVSGKNLAIILTSNAKQGSVFVGYEAEQNLYSGGELLFDKAQPGDDLVFTAYTQINGNLFYIAKRDLVYNINSDKGFFIFYAGLLLITAVFAIKTLTKKS